MSEKENKIREGQASDVNPQEIGINPPAKELKSQEKVKIKESGIGREASQTPADEQQTEPILSQIDDATVALQKKQLDEETKSENH